METKPYLAYNDVLKARFGEKVYKVTIDAGFTCPNRDGTKGRGGCTFCDDTGSSSRAQDTRDKIVPQLLKNIAITRERFKAQKFIAYFQSYTNTYAPIERLKRLYDEALACHPDIIGLAISTRPDCVNEEILDLIQSYQDAGYYVSVEYGMQTIHDHTLEKLNRCETHADFTWAYSETKKRGLSVCVHVILGLPGESHGDIMATAAYLAGIKPNGVKFHCLCAMENTPLAEDYTQGNWQPLTESEYITLLCDFIEQLDPGTALHRIAGNGHRDGLVAPLWLLNKFEVVGKVHQLFAQRGTRQGSALLTPLFT